MEQLYINYKSFDKNLLERLYDQYTENFVEFAKYYVANYDKNIENYVLWAFIGCKYKLCEALLNALKNAGKFAELINLCGYKVCKYSIIRFLTKCAQDDYAAFKTNKRISTLIKVLPRENSRYDKEIKFVDIFVKFMDITKKRYRQLCGQLRSQKKYIKYTGILYHRNRKIKGYFANIRSKRHKISPLELIPPEIVKTYISIQHNSQELENQWVSLIEYYRQNSMCKNIFPIVDITMTSTIKNNAMSQLDVAVGFSVFFAMLNNTPSHNKIAILSNYFYSYEINPSASLESTIRNMLKAKITLHNNLNATLQQLKYIFASYNKSQLPDYILVISDTFYTNINFAKYTKLPKIIIWNTAAKYEFCPVKFRKNVIYLSGINSFNIRSLMDGNHISPTNTMGRILTHIN